MRTSAAGAQVATRVKCAAWVTCAALACAALLLPQCGALDDAAPRGELATHCTTVDQRLQPLLQLADSGKTAHLAGLISQRLDAASQRAVVQLIIDIAYAMPPDTSAMLPDLLAPTGLGALMPLVVAVLAPLPGDPWASPPKPPKTAAMAAFSAVAQTCLSQEMFVLGARLFRDPKAADSVDALLGVGTAGIGQILAALQGAGAQGRKGFVVLVRNLATSLASPDFEPEPLLSLLERLIDPQQPGALGALHAFLKTVILGNTPAERTQAIAALSGFAACFLRLDPEMAIAEHGYDVLVSLDMADQPTITVDTHRWLPIISYVMEVLATRPASRDSWNQLLGLVLRPDVATAALPELVGLLQSDALQGILALLADLVTQPCKKAKP